MSAAADLIRPVRDNLAKIVGPSGSDDLDRLNRALALLDSEIKLRPCIVHSCGASAQPGSVLCGFHSKGSAPLSTELW